MVKILVVEDSSIVTKIIRDVLEHQSHIQALYAATFQEACEIYEAEGEELFVALVDLTLPDAPDGEIVDYVLQRKLPTIVLTGSVDEVRRATLMDKGIVDYVSKEGRYSCEYAISIVERLRKNQDIQVLVVDDSEVSRIFLVNLLRRQLFQVLQASNGVEAIKILLGNPEIKLLITDNVMPHMDGFELVKNLRVKYEKSDLVIIGLSAEAGLSAKFIKNGANDYLQKPFCHEEFNCRVTHNVESLELIQRIRDAANRDHLTGVYNRSYYFTEAERYHNNACAKHSPLSAVAIDLDYFKKINDEFGNEAGDQVLKAFAKLLEDTLERFLIARAGGGEFFLLLPGLNADKAFALVDRVREIIAKSPIEVGGEETHVTYSAGVSDKLCKGFDEMQRRAEYCLYRAKSAGRNIVIADEDD